MCVYLAAAAMRARRLRGHDSRDAPREQATVSAKQPKAGWATARRTGESRHRLSANHSARCHAPFSFFPSFTARVCYVSVVVTRVACTVAYRRMCVGGRLVVRYCASMTHGYETVRNARGGPGKYITR